ncbi:GM11557 [Drosophila sechellia]|uniref:GM11557 n=1 Tax=Drosophila sechellia TaxID=7238 RepID=B4IGE7_DROSE|nr:GM11557 [Drosophila sechellia]
MSLYLVPDWGGGPWILATGWRFEVPASWFQVTCRMLTLLGLTSNNFVCVRPYRPLSHLSHLSQLSLLSQLSYPSCHLPPQLSSYPAFQPHIPPIWQVTIAGHWSNITRRRSRVQQQHGGTLPDCTRLLGVQFHSLVSCSMALIALETERAERRARVCGFKQGQHDTTTASSHPHPHVCSFIHSFRNPGTQQPSPGTSRIWISGSALLCSTQIAVD